MSNYTKATNFATKDTLPTGDANKIVKGTEIDNEFNSISGAISSKADIASPTFTGTPAAPTATTGSNTTQLANTAYVKQEITAQSLGNMSTQAKSAVDITGGTIVGITDLTVADGGTGASSITANSVILGNGGSALSGNLVAPGTSGNVLKSNGTTWTSAAQTVTSGLGLNGETWRTESKTSGTSYTNSRSYPIMVNVTVQLTSNNCNAQLIIGGITVYQYGIASNFSYGTMSGIVPAGGTYQVNVSNMTVTAWTELY